MKCEEALIIIDKQVNCLLQDTDKCDFINSFNSCDNCDYKVNDEEMLEMYKLASNCIKHQCTIKGAYNGNV